MIEVRHNTRASRFEATVEGLLCRADYQLLGDVLRLHHTEVPASLRGRGVAGELVRSAFAWAEANQLKVEPACSYVRGYVERHPEVRTLLAPATKT